MTVKEAVTTLTKRAGISQSELAQNLGYANKSSIAVPLSRDNGMGMKVSTLIRWAEELGYQLILQSPEDESDDLILDGESEFE